MPVITNDRPSNNDGRPQVSNFEKMKAKAVARDVAAKKKDLIKLGLEEKQVKSLLSGVNTPNEWSRRQRFIKSVVNQRTADKIEDNIRKDRMVEMRKHLLGSETKQSLGVKEDPTSLGQAQFNPLNRF